MKVLIGSIGRRNYLIDWFQDAFLEEGIVGRVVTTDADPESAGATAGDQYIKAPHYGAPDYPDFMVELIERVKPDIFFSVNDYEISLVSQLITESRLSPPSLHFFSDWASQRVIEDKYAMASALSEEGSIRTPETVLGSNLDRLLDAHPHATSFVVKHRFGSGSSGVRLATRDSLGRDVTEASNGAPHGSSLSMTPSAMDLVIVQERLPGPEYGVDGVFSASRSGSLDGVLARRKLRMRSGETDKAVTISPARFVDSLTQLGAVLGLRGLVDTDFMATEDGNLALIDVNPRFGGGYPFMHVAGADAPRHYVRAALSREPIRGLLKYHEGAVGAKYEAVRRTG